MRDIAWFAGVYEGEGCASGPRSISMGIAQKDKWLLDRVQALFGGHQYFHRCKKRGYTHWRWQCSGSRARGILMTIYRFLSPRRQAQIQYAFGLSAKRVVYEKES